MFEPIDRDKAFVFKDFDPREGKIIHLLDEDGKLAPKKNDMPLLTNEQVVEAFKLMTLVRVADDWAISLNRQGRMPTFVPNTGQEANSVGSIMAIAKDDWFIQAFRELGGVLYRGIPLRKWYSMWLGNEDGNSYQSDQFHTLPLCVPIPTQLHHSVGLAFAERYLGRDRISLTFVGDGGTSQGDFYESINFAAVWNTPTIFIIQNNQWAISSPKQTQSINDTYAEKAFGVGIEGVKVDGNDIFAVYAATKLAEIKARKGLGPTVIEGLTYRLGAHTTADDPTVYRDENEVRPWLKREPLIRTEQYILSKKLMTKGEIDDYKGQMKKYAQEEFAAAEAMGDINSLKDTFQYMYKEMPLILKEQYEKRSALMGGKK